MGKDKVTSSKKRTNFSQVSNRPIQDKNISLKAKGLYSLIQSYITLDKPLQKEDIMRRCKEGRSGFDSAWNELKAAGYLKQTKFMDENTKKFIYRYNLFDEPVFEKPVLENPTTVKPTTEKPTTEKPHDGKADNGKPNNISNTNYSNTDSNTDNSNIIVCNIDSCNNQSINKSYIRDQIEYDYLIHKYDKKLIDEIVGIICNVHTVRDSQNMKISGSNVSAIEVKEVFKSLSVEHVEEIVNRINSGQVNINSNPRAYMVSMLFNEITSTTLKVTSDVMRYMNEYY